MILEHMDCLTGLKNLPDESVDLVVTDPPYGQGYKTNFRKATRAHRFRQQIANDDDLAVVQSVLPDLYRVMKPDSALYLFCNIQQIEHIKPMVAKHFAVKNVIIWVKNQRTAGDLVAAYAHQYEMILYANKGRCPIRGFRDTDVWEHNRVAGLAQLHQNQKPLDLVERAIHKSSDPGAIVLDPFMGSGTTAVACLQTGRDFIGYEIDPSYYDIAQRRVKEASYGLTKEITS